MTPSCVYALLPFLFAVSRDTEALEDFYRLRDLSNLVRRLTVSAW